MKTAMALFLASVLAGCGGRLAVTSGGDESRAPTTPLAPTPDASFRASPPPGGETIAPLVPPPPPTSTRVEPGFEVRSIEAGDTPLEAMCLVLRRDEASPPGQAELLGSLTAHVLASSQGLVDAEVSSSASHDRICHTGPAGDGVEVAKAFARMVARPRLDTPVAKQRWSLALRDLTSARRQAGRRLFRIAHEELLGPVDELPFLDQMPLAELHRRAVRPGDVALIAYGPTAHADLVAAVEPIASAWPEKAEASTKRPPAAPPTELPPRSTDILTLRTSLPIVAVVTRAPHALHDDRAAFRVLEYLVAGSFDSRINRRLREELGATYSLGSDVASVGDSGLYVVQAVLAPDLLAPAILALQEELTRMRDEIPTPQEVDRARRHVRENLRRLLETTGGVMATLADLYARRLPNDELGSLDERLAELEPADVGRMTMRYLERRTPLIVGAPSRLLETLSEATGLRVRPLDDDDD